MAPSTCADCASTDLAGGVPALHPERKGALNVSPKVNWVEKRGGLPPYINSVATALVRQGMTRQHAIQVAINTIQKACETGLWGGQKRKVSPAVRAAACSALTRWNAMKVSTSVASDERLAIDLAERWESRGSLELAWNHMRARAIINLAFTEELHPRGGKGTPQGGRFVKKGTQVSQRTGPRRAHARNVLRRVGGVKKSVLGKGTRQARAKATGETELMRRWNRLPDDKRLRAMRAFQASGATLPAGWRFLEDGTIASHRSIGGLPTARRVRRRRRSS